MACLPDPPSPRPPRVTSRGARTKGGAAGRAGDAEAEAAVEVTAEAAAAAAAEANAIDQEVLNAQREFKEGTKQP